MSKPMILALGVVLLIAAAAEQSDLQAQQAQAKPVARTTSPAAAQPKAAASAPKPAPKPVAQAARPAPAPPKSAAAAPKPPKEKAAQVPNQISLRNPGPPVAAKIEDRAVDAPVSMAATLDAASKNSQKKKPVKKAEESESRDEPKP
jgi:hypothetical protein